MYSAEEVKSLLAEMRGESKGISSEKRDLLAHTRIYNIAPGTVMVFQALDMKSDSGSPTYVCMTSDIHRLDTRRFKYIKHSSLGAVGMEYAMEFVEEADPSIAPPCKIVDGVMAPITTLWALREVYKQNDDCNRFITKQITYKKNVFSVQTIDSYLGTVTGTILAKLVSPLVAVETISGSDTLQSFCCSAIDEVLMKLGESIPNLNDFLNIPLPKFREVINEKLKQYESQNGVSISFRIDDKYESREDAANPNKYRRRGQVDNKVNERPESQVKTWDERENIRSALVQGESNRQLAELKALNDAQVALQKLASQAEFDKKKAEADAIARQDKFDRDYKFEMEKIQKEYEKEKLKSELRHKLPHDGVALVNSFSQAGLTSIEAFKWFEVSMGGKASS